MLIVACGEAAQEGKPEPTTPPPLEYGDPVELIGVPWSEPQPIDYEGRRVVIFRYAEGAGAEGGRPLRVGFASGCGGQAAKELRAAGVDARQPEPPEYRLRGTCEGWVTMGDGREYEALMVESTELEGSTSAACSGPLSAHLPRGLGF
jgi:hypothetical protein